MIIPWSTFTPLLTDFTYKSINSSFGLAVIFCKYINFVMHIKYSYWICISELQSQMPSDHGLTDIMVHTDSPFFVVAKSSLRPEFSYSLPAG